jgi:2-amino-4-hydroxy-6-hydroxymethyldihydropteridine diphosphokinase
VTESAFSLGSNLGDRLGFLREARRRLEALPGVRGLAHSPVYETEPVGVKPEHRHLAYLNAVVVVESELGAGDWRAHMAGIEAALGRVRGEDRYAPREIDVDLIYHGADVLDGGGLMVPHPRWAARLFVVRPLTDLRPDLVLPGAERPLRAVCADLEHAEPGAVRFFTGPGSW